jgi:hypothetical protein
VLSLACAGALAIALLLQPRREPVYQGHTLSWWIHLYQGEHYNIQAQLAIKHIGTNALPTLLDWLRYEEPPWRTRLINRWYMRRHVPVFLQNPTAYNLLMGAAGRHARDAIAGFYVLGPEAYPAAVELVALTKSKSPFVSQNAVAVITPMQAQIHINALDDPDINVRRAATNTLRIIAPKDTSALQLPNTALDNVTNNAH